MYDPTSDSEEYDDHHSLVPNPALSPAQHPQIDCLRNTLSESLPYCSGTLELPPQSFVLYYGKDVNACRVDLLTASAEALDVLEKACDPATFGLDQKDVLDVHYRKAGKLDETHFSLNLDVQQSGLLEAVRTGILSGQEEKRSIHAELYKLNVYGVGSFFKTHQDTPRGAAMFGSLVLVFPTAHEGGVLVLRQDGREWAIDAAQLLSGYSTVSPRVAYVAFFSDVEHEVQRVTSGHRITITYNLFFTDEIQIHAPNIVQPRSANSPEVQASLSGLLKDQTFLTSGGTLGFGLRHLYPLPTSFNPHDDDTLETLKGRLKGADAALFGACTSLGLAPSLHTIFEDNTESDGGSGARTLVACPRVVKFHTYDYTEEQQPLWEKLCRRFDGVLVNPDTTAATREGIESRRVQWITPLSRVNRVKTRFAAYGNEPMIGYLYQRICMLVDVGSPGLRSQV